MTDRPKTLAGRIAAVAAKLGAVGRDGFNEQQKFAFTSEGEIKRRLNPLMNELGVCVVCHGVAGDVSWESRPTRNGGAQQVVRFLVSYSILNTDDPSDSIAVTLPTEGVDIADKAIWKGLTSATKNLLIHTFSVVRSDDEDPDGHTPEEPVHVRPIGQHAAERFLDAASMNGVDNLEALKAVSEAIGAPVKTRAQLAAVDRAHLETMADLVRDWKQRSGADQVFGGDGGTTDVADDAGPGDEGLDLTPPASIEKMTVPEIKRALVAAFEDEGVAAEDVPRLVRKVLASAGMKLPDGELRKAELAAALVAVRSGVWDLPTADRIPAASP